MSAKPHQLENVPPEFRDLVDNHGKSPWHPSRKAMARVPDPMDAPVLHGCGSPVEIAHHNQVYGKAYGEWPWVYRCAGCDAYVGMHPFTNIPLGTLADKRLREARKSCKQPFEKLWREGMMSRDQAYLALAQHLGIEPKACHFGLFDITTCIQARAWATMKLKGKS